MNIEFKRIERDCDHNTNINEGRAPDHISRSMFGTRKVFDFQVLIDGEHRATWQRFLPRTYFLEDLDRKDIRNEFGSIIQAHQQSEFLGEVTGALRDGLILTVAQHQERTAAAKAKTEAEAAAAKREQDIRDLAAEQNDADYTRFDEVAAVEQIDGHARGAWVQAWVYVDFAGTPLEPKDADAVPEVSDAAWKAAGFGPGGTQP